MSALDQILQQDPFLFAGDWSRIDQVVGTLGSIPEGAAAGEAIANYLKPHPVSKGMPYFRAGHLRLVNDPDATLALTLIEAAYKEDMQYGPSTGKIAQRMGAYRLLALTKGFIQYLESKKNWESEQVKPPNRQILITTLLAVYNGSLVHILDADGHTYQSFFKVIQDKSLLSFAIENYFCAENLIEMFFVQGPHFSRHTNEYPLARAIVGLFAGVLEAMLADKIPDA